MPKILKTTFLFLVLWAPGVPLLASGFAIVEQSVSGLGSAFAGAAASAEDAATIFYNPAGILLIEGRQLVGGMHWIVPSAEFKIEKATKGGRSLGTDNGGDCGSAALVPNLYYGERVNDRLAVGLGITAPFGLTTEYDPTWVGRYHAVKSEVMTVNINPALAYRIGEHLGIGAGVCAQYIDATLSSMADASGMSMPPLDVLVENSGSDWAYGYNLGLIYDLSSALRLGLSYRSAYSHKLKGTAKADIPAALVALNPAVVSAFQTQGINGRITLPASASFSLHYRPADRLTLLSDVSWTQWSAFDVLTLNFEGPGIPIGNFSATTPEHWDDTWRYAVGAVWQATDALALRTGFAFDASPVPAAYRTPRIPCADRFWMAFGAGCRISEKIYLDAAYVHIFVKEARLALESATMGNVTGEYDSAVDIASVQLRYSF